MERLKRKLFKIKKPMPITAEVEDEELYLEPQYSETESITLHIDSIAEELLAIAKKSVDLNFISTFSIQFLFR